MKLSRTKIDRNLSAAQRNMLCDWLLERSSNPTGKVVELGLRELGLWEDAGEPSANSISEWLRKGLAFEMQRRSLAEDAENARVLVEVGGSALAEANKQMLDAELFSTLRAMRAGEAVDRKSMVALAECATMTARTIQQAKKTTADVALRDEQISKLQREHQEWEEKKAAARANLSRDKAKGGVTEETMKLVEEALGL